MRRSPASSNLSSIIDGRKAFSSHDQDSSTTDSKDSPLSFKESSKNSDLLITYGLTFNEIKERIELIENLIKDGLMLEVEDLKKLDRIKRKIQISEKLERVVKVEDDIEEISLSEKYLSPFLLEYFSKYLKKDLDLDGEIKLHEHRTSLRITEDREADMKMVTSHTIINRIKYEDDSAFILKFCHHGSNFEYKVKFKKNKCEFDFELVFPNKKNSKINLFPEEIQLAMFDRLVESFPEVLKKIGDADKINLKQLEIINPNSASLISQYLHLKSLQVSGKEGPSTSVPCLKIFLSSTPNQSNTDNFLNQLIAKYNLEQKKYHPPKVICNSKWNSSLAITATKSEDSIRPL